jgi:low affinity Fe/Cu permease
MLMVALMIAVFIALIGSLPIWPHSKKWSLYPALGITLFLLIVLYFIYYHRS